jgi:hypothetical protein
MMFGFLDGQAETACPIVLDAGSLPKPFSHRGVVGFLGLARSQEPGARSDSALTRAVFPTPTSP